MGLVERFQKAVTSVRLRRRAASLLPGIIRRNYLAKFLIVIGLVVLLGSLVGGYFYVGIADRLDSEVNREVEATNELHATVYGDWFDNRRRALESLSTDPTFVVNSSENMSYELSIAQTQSDAVQEYHVINRTTGRVVGSSEPSAVDESLYMRGLNRTLVSKPGRSVSSTRFQTFEGEQAIALWARTSYANRLIVAEIDPERAGPELPHTIENSTTHVITRNGDRIFGPENVPLVPSTVSSETRINRMNGEVISYREIPNTDLVLVTTSPTENAFAVKETVSVTFAATILSIFCILVIVTFVGGRAAIRDLTVLANKSREMSDGALNVELSSNRRDEIGTLYVSFAEMRDSLRDRISEAQEAKATAQTARDELQRQNEEIAEQKSIISVLNRILRHNLRNDLTIIQGHLAFLQDAVDDEVNEKHIDPIEMATTDLFSKAEKARAIEQLTQTSKTELQPTDVTETLETEVERFGQLYPEAEILTEIEQGVSARAHEALGFVFANLIENGIEHNDSPEPWVKCSLTMAERDHEQITVEIIDDGPGIPQHEVESLDQGSETALRHSSGLGLWLANWLVDEMGGDITFEHREPNGTIVTITLESAVEAPATVGTHSESERDPASSR